MDSSVRSGSRLASRCSKPCTRQHGARRGDHHHREHEQRLGVLARFGIGDGAVAAAHDGHADDQHNRPETEYHLDLAQQMQQAGVARMSVRQLFDGFGGEGMQQCQPEQNGTQQLDGLQDQSLSNYSGLLKCHVTARCARHR